MDTGLCLSDEQRRLYSIGDDSVFEIEYRDYGPDDFVSMLVLLDKFWREVHRENINQLIDLDVNGSMVKVNGLEAKLCQFLSEGMKIKMAMINGRQVGFLIYKLVFDCIMVVRGAYFDEPIRKMGLLREITMASGPNVKRVISQSYNFNSEDVMNKREKVFSDEILTTWITRV